MSEHESTDAAELAALTAALVTLEADLAEIRALDARTRELRAERDHAQATCEAVHRELLTGHFLRLATRAGLREGYEEQALRLATEHRLLALTGIDDQGNALGVRTALGSLIALFPALFEPKPALSEPKAGLDPASVVTRYLPQRN